MLIDNLVSYWNLNQSSGSRLDSHGSNTLSDNNTVTSTTGKLGNCAVFAQANSEYLSIADASQSGLEPTDVFSISMWVKFDSLPSPNDTAMTIVDKYGVNTGYSIFYSQYPSNTYKFDIYYNGASHRRTFNVTLSTGVWYHLVFVIVPSANASDCKLYINNVSKTISSYGGTSTSITGNSTALTFGKASALGAGAYVKYFNGSIDEMGFWHKALSASEVTELFNSGTPLAYPFSAPTLKNPALLLAMV